MHLSPKLFLGFLLLAFGLGAGFTAFTPTGLSVFPSAPENIPLNSTQLAFCPSPACVSLTLSALNQAHSRIDVAMYSFTHPQLAQALIDAHARGVQVRVLVESQQAAGTYSEHQTLLDAGIPVRLDSNPSYMHHKFAVIDDAFVLTGSMNWSRNGVGENNENALLLHSSSLNAEFEKAFEHLWSHTTPPI